MSIDEIKYALAKQLSTAHSLATAYGSIELDDELRQAINNALRPIMTTRLNQMEATQ
ncbi:MAG: hypothetical protein HN344_03330 [Gammaproteobacteria bacterium]|jgi:hypothetical protein|nr:hypothetical protein [Gammaproteobacteria bacterium]